MARSAVRIFIAIIIVLAIAEVALRALGYERSYVNPLHSFHVGHPLVGYLGKPGFTGRFRTPDFDVMISNGPDGFRLPDPMPAADPDSASRRVFVFGDSFTWGWGVPQGTVYTDVMTRTLGNQNDSYVKNYGLNASGTVQQYTLFEHYVRDQLRAGDVVLVMFYRNDFNDNLSGRQRAVVQPDGAVTRVGPDELLGDGLKDAIKTHSYALNLLLYAADLFKKIRDQAEAESRVVALAQLSEDDPEIIALKHFLTAFKTDCEQRGARFAIIYKPGKNEMHDAVVPNDSLLSNEKAYRAVFMAAAESAGVEVIDLLPIFETLHNQAGAAASPPRFSFEHDGHWNVEGHRVAGEFLTDWLRGNTARPDDQ
ncbi:MAG: hypothetical protein HND57_16175 [Planctomycetes bacterium]|nr:hypothetical protein [Planctomycetota bacterium]